MWLRQAADTPTAPSWLTWSCINATRGETTTVRPSNKSAGKLVAERLAAAGRHDHQRVLALQNANDDLGLDREEPRVTKGLPQYLESALLERGRGSGGFNGGRCARRRWRRRPRQRFPGASCGFKEPPGQLHKTAQLLRRPFLGPPPVGQGNAQQRAGRNLGDRLLKTDKGQRAPAVAGGVAIAEPFALAIQPERLVRHPEHRAAMRQPGALGDVEPARRSGLREPIEKLLRPAHQRRHKAVDGFRHPLRAPEAAGAQHDNVLHMRRNDVRVRHRVNFPHLADLVFEARALVAGRVAGNQPDAVPLCGDAADTCASAAPGLGHDENPHPPAPSAASGFGVR